MAAVGAHWACVALAFTMGATPDGVAPVTGIVSVLLALSVSGAIITIRRTQPDGRDRMAAEPRSVSVWRAPVLTLGGASTFFGLFLFAAGDTRAGYWVMAIGNAMIFFELAAIVGAAVMASSSEPLETA